MGCSLMKLCRRSFLNLVPGLATLWFPAAASAQESYPSHPIRLIVGFTPGSASDVIGRVFANSAGAILSQRIVVENKSGAGSSIAAEYVIRARNDGYTLFVPAVGTLANEAVKAVPSFDMSKDFAPIALLASGPLVLVVNPQIDVHSIADLVALAKSKPDRLLAGSAGTVPYLAAELFARRAGIKLVHVPYRGSPETVTETMAGRITMCFPIASAVLGQIAAGELTALATTAKQRLDVLPDVPTMAEAGVPDLETGLWLGLLAPQGTQRSVVERLAQVAHVAMHSPEAKEALQQQGYVPLDAGPDEFEAFIRSEIARWSEVARLAGLKS